MKNGGRARAVIRDLALACDIVVENFRPGVLKRLGLSYDDIAAQKPGIVWCCHFRLRPGRSVSRPPGLRHDRAGDVRRHVAHRRTGRAAGALRHSARRHRRRHVRRHRHSGRGERARAHRARQADRRRACSIARSRCCPIRRRIVWPPGEAPDRQGRGHEFIPTYRGFTCGDGIDIVITANTERMWVGLCAASDGRIWRRGTLPFQRAALRQSRGAVGDS